MTAPTDQFVDIAKRSQEAVTTAVRTWADSIQSFAGNLTGGHAQLPDPQSVVDGYFDFAEKVLATQRRVTSEFVSASVKAGETVQEQVTKATGPRPAPAGRGPLRVSHLEQHRERAVVHRFDGHRRAEHPGRHRRAARPQRVDHRVDQRPGPLRRRGR